MARPILRETRRLELVAARTGPASFFVDVSACDGLTVQVNPGYSAGGAWVVTVRRSNDGVNPFALTTPVTFAATADCKTVDVGDAAFVEVAVTTDGSAGDIEVIVSGTSAF